MNGQITIQLDKESLLRLEKDAVEWGMTTEDYARILLAGRRPQSLKMTEEDKEEMIKNIRLLERIQGV